MTERIRVERTGGFAGLTVTAWLTDPADVAAARALIAAPPAASVGRPDAFVYSFADDAEEAVAEPPCVLPEGAVPETVRTAVARALRAAPGTR